MKAEKIVKSTLTPALSLKKEREFFLLLYREKVPDRAVEGKVKESAEDKEKS